MVHLALTLSLSLAQATPTVVYEQLARKLPWSEGAERITGEFNGLAFFSARGSTPESPRAALGRLQRSFGDKQSIALTAPGGDVAIYWQAIGMQKRSPAQERQMRKVLEEAALQLTVAAYRTSLPPIWAHDMLCTVELLDWPTCGEPDPLALLVAIQRALPNLLWHAVTLTRRDGATHFSWTVWPEVDLGGLFASADPVEVKALCAHAKFPRVSQSVCPIIAALATGSMRARIELMEQPAPASTARTVIGRGLLASGWVEEESPPSGTGSELQQFRHPADRRSLMLIVRPAGAGSRAMFVESSGG